MNTPMPVTPLSAEFQHACLGDSRLVARLCLIANTLSARPEASLPEVHENDSQLEATYRFFSNSKVSAEDVLAAHTLSTVRRAAARETVLVVHDTTSFTFGGHRCGLGRVGTGAPEGFYAHYSLCVGLDGCPLGTVGLQAWRRTQPPKGRRRQQESQYDPDRESLRWNEGVHETDEVLKGHAEAIHVMDREGDCMELFADMLEHERRFIVRVAHDRRLVVNRRARTVPKLYQALATAPNIVEREVRCVAHKRVGKGATKARTTSWPSLRRAHLSIRAQTHDISPGNGAHAHIPDLLRLNFVEVVELSPPEGMEPVQWRLVTTEPIETVDQVLQVVDSYRLRWLIEEFNKALKTGCNFEALQLETGEALIRALVVYTAVAWQLLLLRWMDRKAPLQPAGEVLSPSQMKTLIALNRQKNKPLPEAPSVHDVLIAIAQLGGHLPHNGAPGWLVIRRGFDKLRLIELGWTLRTQLDTG